MHRLFVCFSSRRRHTRLTCDWSSDVCSSDLTLAMKRLPDDVSENEKTARIVALQSLQREIQTRLHERAVGSTVEVLIDSAGRRHDSEISGRTSGNTVVNSAIPGRETGNLQRRPADPGSRIPDGGNASDWIGRTIPVRIHRAGPHSLWGDAVVPNVRRATADAH